MTPEQMKKFDVVLTTYQVVAKEHADTGALAREEFAMSQGPSKRQKKGLKGLFGVHWKVSHMNDVQLCAYLPSYPLLSAYHP